MANTPPLKHCRRDSMSSVKRKRTWYRRPPLQCFLWLSFTPTLSVGGVDHTYLQPNKMPWFRGIFMWCRYFCLHCFLYNVEIRCVFLNSIVDERVCRKIYIWTVVFYHIHKLYAFLNFHDVCMIYHKLHRKMFLDVWSIHLMYLTGTNDLKTIVSWWKKIELVSYKKKKRKKNSGKGAVLAFKLMPCSESTPAINCKGKWNNFFNKSS